MSIEMKIKGLMIDPVTNNPIIVLKDEGGESVLPIWVGIFEANAIAMQLENIAAPRPMTHDLLHDVLGGGGGSSAPAVSDQQRQAANEDAEILIRAMCNAAKADGQIDQSEIDAITSRLGDIDEHEAAFLRRELQAPLDLEAFCDSVPRDLTQQAYAFSLLGMKLDTQREAQYLGAVAQEQELEATFTMKNAGDTRLEGIRPVGDCGCYGVTLSKDALEPGEEGTVTVRFRTLRLSGRQKKRLQLFTANGPPEPVVVRLVVDVIAGVVLEPPRVFFGDVLVGKRPTKTIRAKWNAKAGIIPAGIRVAISRRTACPVSARPWAAP